MVAVWVLCAAGAALALAYLLSRCTAAPAARGVPVAVRFAEAGRIAAQDGAGRRPCEHPLRRPGPEVRRHQPRSYVAHCSSGAALGLRHSRRR
jgi:hypothetical protein